MRSTDQPLGEGYTRKNSIIYGPDGKPCRQCNSLKDLMNMGKSSDQSSSSTSASPFAVQKRPRVEQAALSASTSEAVSDAEVKSQKAPLNPANCPPDVEALGRSTWTLLHTMAANYPPRPTPTQQTDMSSFLRTFSLFYPCWVCAEDFREWMAKRENQPVLDQGWAGLGQWMCRAHNEVNEKLGQEKFDCNLWRQRWKDGFKDGSCDP